MNTILIFLSLTFISCRQQVEASKGIEQTSNLEKSHKSEDTFSIIIPPFEETIQKESVRTTEKPIPEEDSILKSAEVQSSEQKEVELEDTINEEEIIEEESGYVVAEDVDLKEAVKKEQLIEVSETMYPDHNLFDAILKKYVSDAGVVDYAGLKKVEGQLDVYLLELKTKSVENTWSRNEKLTYWINAYNAFTIKLILKNYPVNSIMDINNGKAWDINWINLGGNTYSLNQIENDIIRPQFNEPRIHFAVNCAAQSCPPLANMAYTSANIETLLENNTQKFINNSKYNAITEKAVEVSKVFDWYRVDFGDLIKYLNRYSETSIRSNAKIKFKEYDWSLNGK